MRIFRNSFELMSEMGRELNSYGTIVKPKHYQNKNIEGNEDFITKEIICQQYCLVDLGDPIWLFVFTYAKEWADAEFKERISVKRVNPGEAWELRKDLWKEFLTDKGSDREVFDYTYNERMSNLVYYESPSVIKDNRQWDTHLNHIIDLLKDDPDTRKAVLSIYDTTIDAYHFWGDKRIPCSMYYDFLIRDNPKGEKQLNICYHQRSCDYATFFGSDVYLAWRLMEYVAEKVGVKPGYLFHTIDSLHVYKKDWHVLSMNLEDLQDKY